MWKLQIVTKTPRNRYSFGGGVSVGGVTGDGTECAIPYALFFVFFLTVYISIAEAAP